MARKTDPGIVPTLSTKSAAPQVPDALLAELRGLIESARQHVAQTANATLTMLYWHVGQRICREVLRDGRAEYGEQIVSTPSTQFLGISRIGTRCVPNRVGFSTRRVENFLGTSAGDSK